MENNIMSLFDDDTLPAQNNNKKQAAKKKNSKKSSIASNSLFSFDAIASEEQSAETPNDTIPENKSGANVADKVENKTEEINNSNAITNQHSLFESETIPLNQTIDKNYNITESTESHPIAQKVLTESIIPTDDVNEPVDNANIVNKNTEQHASINHLEDSNLISKPNVYAQLQHNSDEEQKIIAKNLAEAESEKIDICEQTPVDLLESKQDESDLEQQFITEILAIDYNALSNLTINLDQYEPQNIVSHSLEIQNYKENDKPNETKSDENIEDEPLLFQAATPEKYEQLDFDINDLEEPAASLPEWELTKKYYTIGEVALLFNVNTSHIRFWTKEFNFRLRTNRKGDRMYTPMDIDKLRMIHELVKVKRHTIKGAKDILNNKKVNVAKNITLKENLSQLRDLLVEIRSNL